MNRAAFAFALAATLAISTLAMPASAADMSSYKPGYSNYTPAFSWTGFYLGANVGSSSSKYNQTVDYSSGPSTDTSMSGKGIKFEIDAMALYQFQSGIVAGMKATLGTGGGSGSRTDDLCGGGCFGFTDTATTTVKQMWGGTAQAVLGYGLLNNSLLLYGGAGVGFGQHKVNYTETFSGFGFTSTYRNEMTSAGVGPVFELGAMYRVTDNVVARAFYRHTDLSLNTQSDSFSKMSTKYTDNLLGLGLSVKF